MPPAASLQAGILLPFCLSQICVLAEPTLDAVLVGRFNPLQHPVAAADPKIIG
jgi:hypothetical protein